jgi:exonuclease
MQTQLRGSSRQLEWANQIRENLRRKYPNLNLDFQFAPQYIAIRDMSESQIKTFVREHSPIEYSPFSSTYPKFGREDAIATLAVIDKIWVMDTETSGLSKTSEIVDICFIDNLTGKSVLSTLLRPDDIPAFVKSKAAGINKISARELESAPTFLEMHAHITQLLEERPIATYNADYDSKMLERTYYKYDITCPRITAICLMKLISAYLNISDWLSLDEAITLFKIKAVRGLDRHSAAFDAYMANRLLSTLKRFES